MLLELGQPPSTPTLWCDNQSTIALTEDSIYSARSKHIEARYFFLRELKQTGRLNTRHIQGNANPADIFTKPLGGVAFKSLVGRYVRAASVRGGVLASSQMP